MIDVQNSTDYRNIPICNVGIKNVKLPFAYQDKVNNSFINTVGEFSLAVSLPREKKGTHMSRFLGILYQYSSQLSLSQFENMTTEINTKLESSSCSVIANFPYFYEKAAPVTLTKGFLDVQVQVEVQNNKGQISKKLSVIIPIKSLCPCSKSISEYGAHSQRGHITIHTWNSNLSIEDCIGFAEQAASSPLYSILKREDEKYVTEKAYNTPRFVEDLVRETAFAIKEKTNCDQFEVMAENFESIHNHNAWACVKSEDIT